MLIDGSVDLIDRSCQRNLRKLADKNVIKIFRLVACYAEYDCRTYTSTYVQRATGKLVMTDLIFLVLGGDYRSLGRRRLWAMVLVCCRSSTVSSTPSFGESSPAVKCGFLLQRKINTEGGYRNQLSRTSTLGSWSGELAAINTWSSLKQTQSGFSRFLSLGTMACPES